MTKKSLGTVEIVAQSPFFDEGWYLENDRSVRLTVWPLASTLFVSVPGLPSDANPRRSWYRTLAAVLERREEVRRHAAARRSIFGEARNVLEDPSPLADLIRWAGRPRYWVARILMAGKD